ncbi:hypothetical protein niasHS_003759 [Heterodera schachtii]|uniref:Ubiquitin-like protease family profile domain-containing protein n=1 Tax=Heterodera schachtii TaxID=97005 RepID=A0ABD2KHF3_HETSC
MDVANSMQELLINCSSVEIGVYFFAPTKQIELTHEFVTLPLDRGKETLMLSLSFKHITKVEFLDNSEGEGAGLVLFINDFMASKIQTYIDREGTGITDFGLESYTSNSKDKFIVLAIQNKESKFFHRLHEILHRADAYHRNYVIQQMNKIKKKHFYIPITFIDVISSSQWKTLNKLLGIARSDFKQRQLKLIDNNNQNGVGSPRVSVVSTLSDSPNVHPPVNVECQHRVQVGQVHQQQPKCHLPAYTVMTVPILPHNQPSAVVTINAPLPSSFVLSVPTSHQSSASPQIHANASHNKSSPAFLAIPSLRSPSAAVTTVVASQLSPLSTQLPISSQETFDMLFQLEPVPNHLYNEQQTPNLNKHSPMVFGETTVAQYLSLESPSVNKFLPRSLKLPKAPPTNGNPQICRSAPPFLSIQTPPSTSQDMQTQFSPQLQSHRMSKTTTSGSAKVGKREREVHLIDDEENESEVKDNPSDKRSNDTLFSFPPSGRDSCSVHYADLKYLSRNFMLNDTIIDFYLKYIHHCLVPQERRARIFIFNTFFFTRLTQPPAGGKPSNTVTATTKIRRVTSNFQKVKNWTKKVNLFDMDYIIVPINEDIHWYLAIIVNVRHGICSLNTTDNESIFPTSSHNSPVPHLIVLNSLIDPAEDKHLAVRDQLGEYLHLEYADKLGQDTKTYFNKQMMDVVVPTMLPQQKNFIDCGLFLLHFAQLFLSNPPKFISKHSSFRRWYPTFKIKHKRDELRSVIRQLASHVKSSDFVQLPTPKRKNKKVGRRSQVDKMQMILDGMALMGRTRRYSDSELDGIMKDEHFSCLYRPRSLDSLIYENREKPLVLQPPTIAEMSRFKQLRRVRQEIFASQVRQG